jgi:hypothetical protein
MSEHGNHGQETAVRVPPVLFDQDAIPLGGEEQHRTAEAASGAVNEVALAYHGARVVIAERLANRADVKMKELERKERLKEHLGLVATRQTSTITEPDGSRPRPKTWTERFMDRRIEERRHNQAVKQIRRERTVKIYGGDKSDTLGFDARADTMIRKQAAKSAYRRGDLDAHELRMANMQVLGNVNTFENPEQKRTRRDAERAAKKAEGAVRQPLASRWRAARIEDLGKKKGKHKSSAEKHREQLESSPAVH